MFEKLRSITDEWRTPKTQYKAMPAEVIECLVAVAEAASKILTCNKGAAQPLDDALAALKAKVEKLT